MKILVTTDAVGGVWNYSLNLVEALAHRGVEVVLACMGPGPSALQREQLGGTGSRFYSRPYALEWMPDPWSDVEQASDWLLQIRDDEQPDLVHLNGYCHAQLNWDCPVVVVAHSCVYTWWQAVHGNRPDISWHRYYHEVRRGLRSANAVVAPTASMMVACQHLYGPLSNARVIYNGLSMPSEMQSPKEPMVFSMGRLWDDAKNMAALVEAAARIDAPVLIAGEPGQWRTELPANVRLLGYLGSEHKLQFLKRARVYALPVRYEPFGLSFLEAAHCGCALVGGRIDSLLELWGDAMAYVDPDDPSELAQTCNRLLQDQNYLQTMASRACDRARGYSLASQAASYYALYRELLAGADSGQVHLVGAR